MQVKLIVGDKQFSSWSMRGSLLLQECGVNYTEIMLGSDWPLKIEKSTPRLFKNDNDSYGFPSQAASGCCCEITQLMDIAGEEIILKSIVSNIHRVPVLIDEKRNLAISDVMAIAHYIEDMHLGKVSVFPYELSQRMGALSFANHIYSDFLPLMSLMPYNYSFMFPEKAQYSSLSKEAKSQITELLTTVDFLLNAYGENPKYLFGSFSIADIMFAPLAYSFKKWKVPFNEPTEAYINMLLERNIMKMNFEQAELIFGMKDFFPKESINWIANQYRINERYHIVHKLYTDIYHRFNKDDEFDIFLMAKNGEPIEMIAEKHGADCAEIEKFMSFFN